MGKVRRTSGAGDSRDVTTRLQNGRRRPALQAVGKPHGRLALVPALPLPAEDLRDLARAYMAAVLGREFARRTEPTRSASVPYRSHNRASERAAAALASQPGGREVLARVNAALASRAVTYAIGLAAKASSEARGFILDAAQAIADVVLEEGLQSASALMIAGGAAAKFAAASMLFAAALEQSPKVLAASKTTEGEGKGGRATLKLGAHGDLLALAIRASDSARNDVLTLPDVEARHRAEHQAQPGIISQAEAMRRVAAYHAARFAEDAQEPVETPEVPEAPDPQDDPADDSWPDVGGTMDEPEPEANERALMPRSEPGLVPVSDPRQVAMFVSPKERLVTPTEARRRDIETELAGIKAELKATDGVSDGHPHRRKLFVRRDALNEELAGRPPVAAQPVAPARPVGLTDYQRRILIGQAEAAEQQATLCGTDDLEAKNRLERRARELRNQVKEG
jgi:hypothetical protein